MSKPAYPAGIRIRGARQNNLKNLDLDIPFGKLVVVTGLSGSGKSSLAFDTLFAEGQRRYVETFSPYARQFFDRMDKPAVDSIEGIPPAIAIEQRNAVRTTRSTVGTMTEVCDYMKVLWPHVSTLYCRNCGQPVRKDSPQTIWEKLTEAMPDIGSQIPDTRSRIPDEGRSPYAAMELRDQPAALSDPASGIRHPGSGIREALITFHLPLSDKLSVAEQLALVAKQGFQRLLIDGQPVRIEDAAALIGYPASGIRDRASHGIDVIQDRIKLAPANRSRFTEACEQAFHFGHGKLAVHELPLVSDPQARTTRDAPRLFSNRFHCATCDLDYREPSAALFSFNHPVGACPECKGFGRIITIDYNLAIPDRSKTLADGAVKPWQTETGKECQRDMLNHAGRNKCPLNVPFRDLPEKWQRWVVDGDPGYGKDKDHEWPKAWYGVKGYFRWLESKAYKMHVRVLLSRYRAYTQCPTCQGQRFQPEALLFRLPIAELPLLSGSETTTRKSEIGNRKSQITLSDFYLLPVRDALRLIDALAARHQAAANDPLALALREVQARLTYLDEVGLGYLTLDRATRTLSGGETARVNLTSCLGSRLVNTLFVLDEPSVGLHPRDTDRLVKVLQRLRDQGNTVVVVEHESNVMRAADQIIDLGPGHGESGGELVFQGTLDEMLRPVGRASLPGKSDKKGKGNSPGKDALPTSSLTADYLSGRKFAAQPKHRPISGKPGVPRLKLARATRHNLSDVTVEIPLQSFVCVSGVSGSGKSTLIRDILMPLLEEKLGRADDAPASSDGEKEDETENETSVTDATLTGHEALGRVVLVDQSSLGRTPRSNPAVYIGAFEDLRELFAQTDLAKQRGLNASAFSFNSGQGQCERCRGAGFEKIEMQFLSDVFVRCPDCDGRRYRGHILEVKLSAIRHLASGIGDPSTLDWSIADLLDATVDDAIGFLEGLPASKPATRARKSLLLLQEIGLGYLRLGQPINTLSGGESQRLKLVRHLADFSTSVSQSEKPTLFLFDEPTTGLHFEDVRILVGVFQRIVDAGHSVLVIEHNLDVIRSADWVIDLGPDAGDEGGKVVAEGTPEQIMSVATSRTGEALRQ
jgi:excinuclease ABC subunit A